MASRTPTPDGGRERLPTLFEVLSRRTRSPVDLFSFYIYMRDVQRSVDYLDFWLDVSQHMSLCRHYVRELRRSVLVSTPNLDKSGSKRSSQVLANYDLERTSSEQGPSQNPFRPESKGRSNSDQRLSAFLRTGDNNGNGNGNTSDSHDPSTGNGNNGSRHSPHASESGLTQNNGDAPSRPSFVTAQSNSPQGGAGGIFHSHSNSSPENGAVSRTDIRASAEKILYTYLLPGAEREIILPQGVLNEITTAIEREGRDDPEVFDAAKDYVFQAMERDAFPGFLRAKALGNIVQPSMLGRLIVGLVSMFAAFWAAFVLIFLDKSRATRCWVILPFTVGVYFLATHQYMLDPVLALVGFSEYTFMNFVAIKEPFVRKLLNKRSLTCLIWITLIDAALCCLFIFVPGKRL